MKRSLAFVVVSCLVGGVLSGTVSGAASAAPVAPSVPEVMFTGGLLSSERAQQLAVSSDREVLTSDALSETTSVTAEPDGSFAYESDSVPVRTEQDGNWVPIDTTLSEGDSGYLEPAATTVPVRLSEGGSDTLAQVQTADGSWVSETWPLGDLPTPTVEGNSATYADVLPDVDLQLTADSSGFSEVFVVKTPEAAENPEVQQLTLGVEGATVTDASGGGTVAEAADGSTLVSSTPMWWDSTAGGNVDGAQDALGSRPLESTADDGQVVLDVASVTGQSDLQYPLYVDPDWNQSFSRNAYWYIDSDYPNTTYLNGAQGTTEERVGYINSAYTTDGSHTARAFYKFITNWFYGKEGDMVVNSAVFNTTETWAFNCTASTVKAYQVYGVGIGDTWNETPLSVFTNSNAAFLQSKTVAYGGHSGCPSHAVGFDARNAMHHIFSTSNGITDLGLKAADETDSESWKRFSPSATLVIHYDRYPTASDPTIVSPARFCGTSSDPAWINNATDPIQLGAKVTDPDGTNTEQVDATFSVEQTSSPGTVYASGTSLMGDQTSDPQNAKYTFDVGKFPEGDYQWSAVGGDAAGQASLAPTATCYFSVDDTGPGHPSASLTSVGTPVVGQPITVHATAPATDHATGFIYWWVEGTAANVPTSVPVPGATVVNGEATGEPLTCGASDGTSHYACVQGVDSSDPSLVYADLTTVAPIDNTSTLWVETVNRAGIISVPGSTLGADDVPVTAADDTANVADAVGHRWFDDIDSGTSPVSIPDKRGTGGVPLSINDASRVVSTLADAVPNDPGETPTPVFSIPSSGYTVGSSGVASAASAVDLSKAFTLSAWLRPMSGSGTSRIALSGTDGAGHGYTLGLNASNQWTFCLVDTTTSCATSGATATITYWYFVTGVWDPVNQQLRVYVGTLAGVAGSAAPPTGVPISTASASVRIGADLSGATVASQWLGEIGAESVYPGVASNAQISNLSNLNAP